MPTASGGGSAHHSSILNRQRTCCLLPPPPPTAPIIFNPSPFPLLATAVGRRVSSAQKLARGLTLQHNGDKDLHVLLVGYSTSISGLRRYLCCTDRRGEGGGERGRVAHIGGGRGERERDGKSRFKKAIADTCQTTVAQGRKTTPSSHRLFYPSASKMSATFKGS